MKRVQMVGFVDLRRQRLEHQVLAEHGQLKAMNPVPPLVVVTDHSLHLVYLMHKITKL